MVRQNSAKHPVMKKKVVSEPVMVGEQSVNEHCELNKLSSGSIDPLSSHPSISESAKHPVMKKKNVASEPVFIAEQLVNEHNKVSSGSIDPLSSQPSIAMVRQNSAKHPVMKKKKVASKQVIIGEQSVNEHNKVSSGSIDPLSSQPSISESAKHPVMKNKNVASEPVFIGEKSVNEHNKLSSGSIDPLSSQPSIAMVRENSVKRPVMKKKVPSESVIIGEQSVNEHNKVSSRTIEPLSLHPVGVDNSVLQYSTDISVRVNNNQNGCRVWNKAYSCFYCDTEQLKLPRHLYRNHSTEPEVAEIIASKDKKFKLNRLCKIRNLGTHKHNIKVLKEGNGELLVVYRPDYEARPGNYLPCQYCFGYYATEQLWRHVQRCKLKPSDSNNRKNRPVLFSRMLLPSTDNDNVSKLLLPMRKDAVFMVIKGDSLMLCYAQKLMRKAANSSFQANYIRNRLRELGRLIIHMRNTDPQLTQATLSDLLVPTLFQSILKSVRSISGYDDSANTYVKPSISIRIGQSLTKCARILKGLAYQDNDEVTSVFADRFQQLCCNEWNDEISGSAHRTLQTRQLNKPFLLPLTEDVTKLNEHLNNIIDQSIATLTEKADSTSEAVTAYRLLAESSLVQLILFNRRREGEVSRLSLKIYRQVCETSIVHQTESEKYLSSVERNIFQKYTRLEIPGKRQRTVPLLLTEANKEALRVLSNDVVREAVGVNPDNSFVFAIPCLNSTRHIRGSDALRKYSVSCGAINPEQLRSTSLRKHVATLSQVLNLKENELDQLAKFMGHDLKIHREFYRLPDAIVQTAKVAKILIAMEQGNIHKYKGMSLDEIDVNDETELDKNDESELAINREIQSNNAEDIQLNNEKEILENRKMQSKELAAAKNSGILTKILNPVISSIISFLF